VNLAQSIVAGSQMQKCGLKYVIHTTGMASLVSLKYGMRKAGSTALRDTVGIDSAINVSSSD
jgi:hypothetical protein